MTTEERLDAIERKLDQILHFTSRLEALLGVYLSGGRGKLLATLIRAGGGQR